MWTNKSVETDDRTGQTSSNPIDAPSQKQDQPLTTGNKTADAGYGATLALLRNPQAIALVGFVVIAATGNLDNWKFWVMYTAFLFLLPIHEALLGFVKNEKKQWGGTNKYALILALGILLGMAVSAIFLRLPEAIHNFWSQHIAPIDQKQAQTEITDET